MLSALERLIAIVAQLRSPQGCAWDRAQTPETLTPFILEEAYETVAAIKTGDPVQICDELGDLLLQIVLQAQIFAEVGSFDLGHVAAGIAEKMVRRHPHVFGGDPDLTPAEVQQQWEKTKQAERPNERLSDKLHRYADSLPPLMAAQKISQKVVSVGFEWPEVEGIWHKVAEEEAELRQALAQQGIPEQVRQDQLSELGDLLFAVVNLGRWYGLDAAEALAMTNRKFAQRFAVMEEMAAGDPLEAMGLEQLEELWAQAKQRLRDS